MSSNNTTAPDVSALFATPERAARPDRGGQQQTPARSPFVEFCVSDLADLTPHRRSSGGRGGATDSAYDNVLASSLLASPYMASFGMLSPVRRVGVSSGRDGLQGATTPNAKVDLDTLLSLPCSPFTTLPSPHSSTALPLPSLDGFPELQALAAASPLQLAAAQRWMMTALPGAEASLLCNEALDSADPPRSSRRRSTALSPPAIRPSPNRGHLSPHVMDMMNSLQARGSSAKTPEKKKNVVQRLNFDSGVEPSMLSRKQPLAEAAQSSSPSLLTPAPITPAQPGAPPAQPQPLEMLVKAEPGSPSSSEGAGGRGGVGVAEAVVPKPIAINRQSGSLLGILEDINNGPAGPNTPAESPAALGAVGAAAGGLIPQGLKRCNCTKSKCLKLYCDCFKTGNFCVGCMCRNCNNTKEHESIVRQTVEQIKQRNPDAFAQKIAGDEKKGKVQHRTGCNCKRSGCRKKYCECFHAGVTCGDSCKCINCKNQLDHPEVAAQVALLKSGTLSAAPSASAHHIVVSGKGGGALRVDSPTAASSPRLSTPETSTHGAQVFTGMPGGALPGQAGQKVMANFDCLSAPSLKVSSSGSSAKKGGASGRKTDKSAKEAGAEAAQLVNEQIVHALGKQQSGVGGKRNGGNGGTRSAKKQCNALTT